MLFQQLLKLEQRPIDSCFKSPSFSTHISLYFREGGIHLFCTSPPSLSLQESNASSFSLRAMFYRSSSTLETLLVAGKGQPGSTPGREHSVRVLLGNALSLDSDQEGQSGDRKEEEMAWKRRIDCCGMRRREPQLKYCIL